MHKPLSVKTLEEAREEFAKYYEPAQKTEKIPLENASGRILSGDVKSQIDLPPFDRSVYDGFAVRGEDTFGAEEDNPIELSKKGEIHAGEKPQIEITQENCAKIATGAVVPEGADAVVMVEDSNEKGEKVEIRRAVSPGENISAKGSEIKKGEIITKEGQKISPQVRGALFAAGVKKVKVIKKPKVAVISTGEEVVKPEKSLETGELYDVNGPAICNAVELCGGESSYLGIVGDELSDVKDLVGEAISSHDVVITSGGSSAGSKDIVPEAINQLGEPGVIIHGLAQKPGKPTLVSMVEDKPIFGLPGYPVSALMVFDQLVAPYIREVSGVREPERKTISGKLSRKVLTARGRRELVPVSVIESEDEYIVKPLREGSGAITSLANADGYIDVSLDREILEEEEKVTINLFGGGNLG